MSGEQLVPTPRFLLVKIQRRIGSAGLGSLGLGTVQSRRKRKGAGGGPSPRLRPPAGSPPSASGGRSRPISRAMSAEPSQWSR